MNDAMIQSCLLSNKWRRLWCPSGDNMSAFLGAVSSIDILLIIIKSLYPIMCIIFPLIFVSFREVERRDKTFEKDWGMRNKWTNLYNDHLLLHFLVIWLYIHRNIHCNFMVQSAHFGPLCDDNHHHHDRSPADGVPSLRTDNNTFHPV